jgi:CheY-like chemotaxis protein
VNEQYVRHVVAVMARALPADQRRCLSLGCSQVITKPFTIDQLENVLDGLAQAN